MLFAGLEWGAFHNFESGSLTSTSVIIILPLGTLVAQRIATAGTLASNGASRRTDTSESKKRFLGNWSHHSNGTAHVTSLPKEKVDPVDLELQRIDASDEPDSNTIWVRREVEQHSIRHS